MSGHEARRFQTLWSGYVTLGLRLVVGLEVSGQLFSLVSGHQARSFQESGLVM